MKHETIVAGDMDWIGKVAKTCGEVTVGCTDVGGVVLDVIGSSVQLQEQQQRLSEVIHRFAADQKAAADASDEARILSERARARLSQGAMTVKESSEELNQLIDLAQGLGQQITGFAAAVEQVGRVSQTIDQIARTTNMLALNAAIEAQKAGAAGATFAVVAAEVKKLASDTRSATVEISTTMHSLGREAQRFIGRVEEGARHSQAARAHLTEIDQAMNQAGEIVALVDEQSDEIARRAAAAHGEVLVSQDVLSAFAQANASNDSRLREAHSHIMELESLANDMFDALVHSGASPIDSHFVAMAQEEARHVTELTEAALRTGELSEAALFDRSYVPIEGSNPPRFRTGLSSWADAHWRPVIDRIHDRDPRISGAIMSDMNGFLPTHSSDASRAPTGELKHDTTHCRNGRIIFGPADQKAKRSTADYMMVVYRQEGDGRVYKVMRNVYVPLHFAGRRWGDLEIAYML